MATAEAEPRIPFRSANPALSASTFDDLAAGRAEHMTLEGTVVRTAFLLALTVGAAAITWTMFYSGLAGAETPARRMEVGGTVLALMWVGILGGLVVGVLTVIWKSWSPVTAPAYAALEGLALGGISANLELVFPGIVLQAVGLTFGTLAMLLVVYRSGVIQPDENFKLGVAAATGGIAVVYLVSIVVGLFGKTVPFIHESGPVGIGFSVFVVVIAALNLVLDFDFIESGVRKGAPKYMEWYGAFGLMVTLIWLYLEILRLLSKIRGRGKG